jgi:hypothetical protein
VGEDYQTKLHKVVAPEYLPKKYGGNLDWDIPGAGEIKKLDLDIPKMEKVSLGSSPAYHLQSFFLTNFRKNGSPCMYHVVALTSKK